MFSLRRRRTYVTDGSSCVKGVREENGAVVVAFTGDIDLHHAPEAHLALMAACDSEPARVVVNLEDVTYMDSSGLGVLVEVLRKVRSFGGTLRLCCLSERVRSVFEITRLDHFFDVRPTEEEAIGP